MRIDAVRVAQPLALGVVANMLALLLGGEGFSAGLDNGFCLRVGSGTGRSLVVGFDVLVAIAAGL
jgi:hypothetical protein